MLDRVQPGACSEHPAREHAHLALQRHLVHLDETVGVRRLGRRTREARARRDLQRAELHRLIDRDVERDDASSDLVEAGEHCRCIRNLQRRRSDHHLVVRRRGRCGRIARLTRGRAARLALARRQSRKIRDARLIRLCRGPSRRGRQILLLDPARWTSRLLPWITGLLISTRRRRITLLRRRRIAARRGRHHLRVARPHLLLRTRGKIAVVGVGRSRLRNIAGRARRPPEYRAELRGGRRRERAGEQQQRQQQFGSDHQVPGVSP